MILRKIKKFSHLIFLLSLLLLLLQCGLNDYPYLYPPDLRQTIFGHGGAGTIIIRNDPDNDIDEFLGYELYYKFYNSGTQEPDRANDSRVIFSVNNPEPRNLISLGFRRVNTNQSYDITTRSPMIRITNKNTNYDIIFDFSGILGFGIIDKTFIPKVYGTTTTEIPLYRGRNNVTGLNDVIEYDFYDVPPTNNYKSFGNLLNTEKNTNIIPGDLQGLADAAYNSEITLSLYIFAFGRYENQPIYSKPLEIGFIYY